METLQYMIQQSDQILRLTGEHLLLALVGVLYALLVGIPVGLLIVRFKPLREPILWLVNALQTIPALALIGFIMIFTGLTATTGILAIFCYCLMPIIRATYTGVTGVDPALIEAAHGMGMTRWQLMRLVQLPLALAVMLDGFRVATVIGIGSAAMMSLAGAGGLGQMIFAGIDRVQTKMILAGALPAVLLAILAEVGIGYLGRRLTPRGLRTPTVKEAH